MRTDGDREKAEVIPIGAKNVIISSAEERERAARSWELGVKGSSFAISSKRREREKGMAAQTPEREIDGAADRLAWHGRLPRICRCQFQQASQLPERERERKS